MFKFLKRRFSTAGAIKMQEFEKLGSTKWSFRVEKLKLAEWNS